jgi:cytochrome c5
MMRNAILSAVALLALSASAFAQTTSKAVYDELCLSCHKQPQRLAARLANTAEARAKLDAFLVKHYASDAQKRAAVVEFLYQGK